QTRDCIFSDLRVLLTRIPAPPHTHHETKQDSNECNCENPRIAKRLSTVLRCGDSGSYFRSGFIAVSLLRFRSFAWLIPRMLMISYPVLPDAPRLTVAPTKDPMNFPNGVVNECDLKREIEKTLLDKLILLGKKDAEVRMRVIP